MVHNSIMNYNLFFILSSFFLLNSKNSGSRFTSDSFRKKIKRIKADLQECKGGDKGSFYRALMKALRSLEVEYESLSDVEKNRDSDIALEISEIKKRLEQR